MSKDGTVSIVTGYGQDDRGSNPSKAGLRKIFRLEASQEGLRSMKLRACKPIMCSCLRTLVVLVFDGSVPPAEPLSSGTIVMSGS